jgi:hypothetical protein
MTDTASLGAFPAAGAESTSSGARPDRPTRSRPAQGGLDPGDEHHRVPGLGDVVVGAGLEPLDDVDAVVAR